MKKLISLILAVLMAGLCACGIAEETEQSGGSVLLRIKEGMTAQVFAKPGDGQAIDTLAGGRICGKLGEETAETGTWFWVFYLDSPKAGAAGYINAKDAEQLTDDQMKALMEDPATFNEILDLIDAMNAYLSKEDGNTEIGGNKPGNEMKTLYERAMDSLKKIFNTSVSAELDNLEKEGKEIADKVKETGKALLDKAKKTGKDLKDGVTDALSSLKGKDIGEVMDSLKDRINETVEKLTGKSGFKVEDVLGNVSDALKDLRTRLNGITGNQDGGIADIVNNAKDWLNNADFSKVNDTVNSLVDKVKDWIR